MEDSRIPTSVTFTLTQKDLLDYNRTVIARVPLFVGIVWLRRISLPAYALLASVYFGLSWPLAVLIALLTALVWIPITMLTFRLRVQKMAKASPGLLHEQTMAIGVEGLHQKASFASSDVPWTSVVDVVTTESQVLFFLNRRYALIVPTSAFAYPSEAKAFADMARQWWADARRQRVMENRNHG